jgi:hypothetical protein
MKCMYRSLVCSEQLTYGGLTAGSGGVTWPSADGAAKWLM